MQTPRETRVDIDGMSMAVMEWQGDGDPILLLHATGFHSRCWNQVVRQLPGRHIYAADLRFHGASDSHGSPDWGLMTRDICQLIKKLGLNRLIGVGHSIGGHLVARAAARMPDCFRHLILIDPVIMSPERYAAFKAVAGTLHASDHPVSRRKNTWQGASEMFERFKGRAPFNTWQPEVLRDYCDYALLPTDANAEYQLACDPINEAGIYLNQEGNDIILQELPNIVTPVTLLRAAPGDEDAFDLSSSPTWPGLAAALPHCREIYLPQMNHFIPMQAPELVATYIREV
ncbi:MAG: alpha/beta hydrolase [Halioglobus sp.]|nr:alpha/beta hydrolase [Halioglobus sp.]